MSYPAVVFLPAAAGLLLTPGASADRDHSTLVAIDEAIPELPVHRLTLGTTSIPKAVAKIVDATEAMAQELGVETSSILLGGRSFGGRACSVAVADGLDVAGLVLLSYPLHPPGKPDKLRIEHFSSIGVPTMFISGSRDPFGSPDEFEEHLGTISGETKMLWVGGAHSPRGSDEAAVVELLRRALVAG